MHYKQSKIRFDQGTVLVPPLHHLDIGCSPVYHMSGDHYAVANDTVFLHSLPSLIYLFAENYYYYDDHSGIGNYRSQSHCYPQGFALLSCQFWSFADDRQCSSSHHHVWIPHYHHCHGPQVDLRAVVRSPYLTGSNTQLELVEVGALHCYGLLNWCYYCYGSMSLPDIV